MKRKSLLVSVSLLVVVAAAAFWFWQASRKTAPPVTTETLPGPSEGQTGALPTEGGKMLTIETAYGNVDIELYPQDAPKTVARILELAKKGFYDGLTFHRVVPNFVVQGGDPRGDGTGGSGQNLPAEFNSREHVEGTVAMARAQDPNSADSQFYIALARLPHLDKNYTVFGQVVKGMDAVKKIKVGDKMIKVTAK